MKKEGKEIDNMNVQDSLLKEKIEKREKFDTILAYILMGVLVGCIVLVVVLKLNDKEEEPVVTPDEYTPNYISLDDVSNRLNNSELVNSYIEDGADFSSSVSNNTIVVSYVKDDTNVSFNVPLVSNELVIDVKEENRDIVTDIYKEIASIVCVYYDNEEKYCRNTLDNMDKDGNDGIRIVNTENNSTIYIDVTKSYSVNDEIMYSDVTKVSIDEYDYVLNILDYKIYDIGVAVSSTNILVDGKIDRLTDDTSSVSVLVKLYDNEDNILAENKYEFNEENVLDKTGTFNVEFIISDDLKLNDISRYSIEIVK